MASGSIPIGPRRILLWENSGTAMASDTEINLSSSDYDDLEVEFRRSGGNSTAVYTQKFPKGVNLNLTTHMITSGSTNDTFITVRTLTRNSDTKFTAGAGLIARWGGTPAVSGSSCVPMKIYGIKY
jgi:hypothetical protein